MRVLLIEQHSLLRDGIAALISEQPDIDLVRSTGAVQEAMKHLIEIKPDIVIIDVDRTDGDALTAIRAMVEEQPGVRVIALIRYEWDAPAVAAIEAGARMIVAKDQIGGRLVSLIREPH